MTNRFLKIPWNWERFTNYAIKKYKIQKNFNNNIVPNNFYA